MATPTTLPATFTAGNVLTAAQMNDLRGAFRILQVVNAKTSTTASSSVQTFADTNLTATITPSSTSSKILVLVSQNGLYKTSGGGNAVNLKLLRAGTNIQNIAVELGYSPTAQELILGTTSTCYLDSPATTSATIYKTQFSNRVAGASVSVQINSAESTITLMEISA